MTVFAATTPSPSPSTDLFDDTIDAAFSFWTWFTGWPLHVLIVLVVGVLVLAVSRRFITRMTDRIAKGYQEAYAAERDGSAATTRSKRARKIIVEDALHLVTPALRQRRARRARTVGSVLTSATNIIIITTMIVLILNAVGWGGAVSKLLGAAGIVGIAVGFGAQTLVRDFLSGLFILMEDQYGVGDVVDLGAGATGTVEKMDLRLTHVRAFDGTLWHVRNGEILRAGNRTQQWGRAVAEVKVPVGSDVEVVREALVRAAQSVEESEHLGKELLEEPTVRGVDAITADYYTFTIHTRVRPGHADEVMRALLAAAYEQLMASGIIVTAAVPEPDLGSNI